MAVRSSFSQHMTFERCKRQWYFQHVKKISYVSDMSYADAGKAVHETLQEYYDSKVKTLDEARVEFDKWWKNFKLDEGILKTRKDEYWLMVINGIHLNKEVTSTELQIYYPEIVSYLDIVNSKTDEIGDWKSSKRTPENEAEYKKQLMVYAWMYNRKFNRLPSKVTIYYLRYAGSNGELSIVPTEEDINNIEEWYFDILGQMDMIREARKLPPMCEECNIYCPYQTLCGSTTSDGLKYKITIVGNNITLSGPLTPLLNKGLERKFSYELKDAYWIKKKKPMANTTVSFWNPYRRTLPLGFLEGLKKTLTDYAKHKKCDIVVDIDDKREFDKTIVEMPPSFLNDITLRNYQVDAVDKFLKAQIGILEIGTGGGKTEIAIECIRRLGVKTLFIVDKIELLRQTKKRIENSLGIKVGTIGAGEDNIEEITVATVQTLTRNLGRYASYLRGIRFCIFDETHKVAARSYVSISRQLIGSEYRLGISGTAYRDDGNDMMINAATGYIIFDLGSKRLIEEGWLVRPEITFIKEYMTKEQVRATEDALKEGLINETPKYRTYYGQFIAYNAYRNNTVLNLVNDNKGKKILILVKLIEHGQLLESMIEGSKYLHGTVNKKERAKMVDNFKEGELNILISTISIFSEGVDIPPLDVVINAAANKGNVKTIQVLGRVLRKMEGKENAKYIDFIDETRFFRTASYSRVKALRREEHNVKIESKERTSNGVEV